MIGEQVASTELAFSIRAVLNGDMFFKDVCLACFLERPSMGDI